MRESIVTMENLLLMAMREGMEKGGHQSHSSQIRLGYLGLWYLFSLLLLNLTTMVVPCPSAL
jgi:hypothetical protein